MAHHRQSSKTNTVCIAYCALTLKPLLHDTTSCQTGLTTG